MSNVEDSYFGSLPPGTVIGDYEVEGELGEGGMGMVFQARHGRLGHLVALKVLAPQLARNQALVRRFEQEARVQANLKHPNIVRCHDFIRHERLCAMVMEYVDGAPLDDVIRNQTGPMPEERIHEVMLPVLDAIGFAHEQGVVHRDLKPSNIMLAREAGREVPKVMDFGIAKLLEDGDMGTATGSKLGTLHYMSPEQCTSSRDVDERSDVYALGVTLFEMAAGRVPFDEGSDFELMKNHMETEPPAPRQFYPGVSEALETVIITALEKDPARRYQSVAELRRALTSEEAPPAPNEVARPARRSRQPAAPTIVEEETEPAAAEATPGTTSPTASRTPLLVVAALLVLGLIGGGVALMKSGGEEPVVEETPAPGEKATVKSKPAPSEPKAKAPALSPAASADLDRVEEHLEKNRYPEALAGLQAVHRSHGESGRSLALLLRYYLARTGMWSGINKYHAGLPGTQAAMVEAKKILDRLRRWQSSLTSVELYYMAHGHQFYGALNVDEAACARGIAAAEAALKKGFSEPKHVAGAYNALGLLQAYAGKKDAGDRSLRRTIKERQALGAKPMRLCADAWNLAAVPLWGAPAAELKKAMRSTHDRYAQIKGLSWYPPRCPKEPGGFARVAYEAACRRKGCMQQPKTLKLFFRGWANLIYGKEAAGKRLLKSYLARGGGAFTQEARALLQKAASAPGGGAATYLGGPTGAASPAATPKPKPKAAPAPKLDAERAAAARELFRKGLQQLMQGNASGAVVEFNSALEKNPRYTQAYRGMGVAYEKLGRKTMARAAFRRYLILNPKARDAEAIKKRAGGVQDVCGRQSTRCHKQCDKQCDHGPGVGGNCSMICNHGCETAYKKCMGRAK